MANPKKKWSVEQRLEFIEFRLYWEGKIKRADLVDQFGISVPQASLDIGLYRESAPNNIEYDSSLKSYVVSKKFGPVCFTPNPERYLAQLGAINDGTISLDETLMSTLTSSSVLPIPTRKIAAKKLRAIIYAIRHKNSIDIEYISMSKSETDSLKRTISPHSLCSDGMRWHVRAFCHASDRFKDFIISRFIKIGKYGDQKATSDDDIEWNTFVTLHLVPNPELTIMQKKAIELDYGMKGGKCTIKLRQALLYYFDKTMRFDIDRDPSIPKMTPVIVENKSEYEQFFKSIS